MSQEFFPEGDFESDAPIFDNEDDMDDGLNFDDLRRQSARSGSAFDNMEMDADSDSDDDYLLDNDDATSSGSSGSRFSLRNFTPMQRLILGVLFLLNIGAIGFGVLVVMGIVS